MRVRRVDAQERMPRLTSSMFTRKRSDGFVRKTESSGKSAVAPNASPGLPDESPQPRHARAKAVTAHAVRKNLQLSSRLVAPKFLRVPVPSTARESGRA
jgi:hypothetical protein